MAIDLDGFKSVNDLEGHQRGDQVLSVFARVLDSEVGQAAHVDRTGGDEFAVLAPFHPADGWLEEAVDTAVLAARSARWFWVPAPGRRWYPPKARRRRN